MYFAWKVLIDGLFSELWFGRDKLSLPCTKKYINKIMGDNMPISHPKLESPELLYFSAWMEMPFIQIEQHHD